MRLTALATALIALLPLTAAGQRVADVGEAAPQAPRLVLLDSLLSGDLSPASGASAPRVVPVWTSQDGRILTAVAMDGGSNVYLAPLSPQISSALDWRLVHASALVTSELRLDDGQRLRAAIGLGQQTESAMQPAWQAECLGVPGWLGNLSSTCATPASLALHRRAGEISAGWSDGPLSVDLAYGFSWLDNPHLSVAAGALGSSVLPLFPAGSALPTLVLPGALGRVDSSSELGARGRWDLGGNYGIDLGASMGHLRLLPDAEGNRNSYSQAALSLGLDRGPFSGNITGRLFTPQQPSVGALQRYTSIDLGVTWRTPWQGELRVGTQNLWTTPPVTGDEAENQARVPYVQYHQDL
jgi:hypothetical protein